MDKPKKIVIICEHPKLKKKWTKAFQEKASDVEVEIYPEDTQRKATEFILTYDPPEGVFEEYPNLKVISSMTAGINHILKDKHLPERAKVIKVNDSMHRADMAVFALTVVLNHLRNMPRYNWQKQQNNWKPYQYKRPEEVNVGIMGIGAIGQEIGHLLRNNGVNVTGWSRSKKDLPGIKTFSGKEERSSFLKTAEILICMLPLTPETQGILNKSIFAELPRGAYLINLARGGHLVEADLEQALQEGQLSGAALDVFNEEPLPENHSFWSHPKISITPHIAGIVNPNSAIKTVLKNYEAMQKGEELMDVVDISRGY